MSKKKALAAMLAALVLFIPLCFTTALAETVNGFAVNTVSDPADNSITVTVLYDGTQEHIGGLRLSVQYESETVSYVQGSRKVSVNGITASELGNDIAVGNKVNFVWSGNRGKGVCVSGTIVSYTFSISSDVKSGTDIPFTVTVYEFFKDDSAMTDIIYSNITLKKSATVIDNEVAETEKAINAIGQVVYNEACRLRIENARNAYKALSPYKQTQVKNLYILSEAEETYNRLKNSEADSAVKEKADRFRTKYKALLSKTIDELKLSDETELTSSIAEWEQMEIPIRAETIAEKRLLNSFVIRMKALKSENELRKEAEEIAENIRKTYSGIYALSENDAIGILKQSKSQIERVLNEINENTQYNKYVSEIMSSDIRQMQGLLQKILDASPSQEENAEKKDFENEFGWLLKLEKGAVTKSDLADIKTALYALGKLSDDAQALLTSEKNHLNELLAAAEALPDNAAESEKVKTVYKTKTEYKYVADGNDSNSASKAETMRKIKVLLDENKISPIVWIMIAFFIIGALAFGIMLIIYKHLIKQGREKDEKQAI